MDNIRKYMEQNEDKEEFLKRLDEELKELLDIEFDYKKMAEEIIEKLELFDYSTEFNIGDRIRMKKEAETYYTYTKEGSEGVIIDKAYGIYSVEFTKLTGDQKYSVPHTFDVEKSFAKASNRSNSLF